VHVEASGTPLPLKPMVRGEVYRIAEALRNALRHAEANQVMVEFATIVVTSACGCATTRLAFMTR
jgi:signal transduction histidine kinase